jgi:broad specificity phosphatase PhoE
VIAARLRTRTAYPTQYRDMDQLPGTAGSTATVGSARWRQWIDGMKRPADRSVIYASPLRRAAQTAQIIAARTGSDVVIVEGLRELDVGDLDGLRRGT